MEYYLEASNDMSITQHSNLFSLEKELDIIIDSQYKLQEKLNSHIIPNLIGLELIDVLFLLENAGLEVEFQGTGKIVFQSLENGEIFHEDEIIELKLS